jgi:uroporphyrinogen-III synthase
MTAGLVRSTAQWVDVCAFAKLPLDRGVCALVDRQQVAVFRVSPNDEIFAIANYDPFSKAFVLSRGIVGSKGDVVKVTSPLYKHGFCLRTGASLDDPEVKLCTYRTRVVGGRVQVATTPVGRAVSPEARPQRGPLAGRTVAIAESREAYLLSRMLEEKGATVLGYPLVKIVDSPDVDGVDSFVRELCAGRLTALVLVTGEGVRRLVGAARRNGMEAEAIAALRSVWTVTRGPKPARALRELGVLPNLPTEHPTTEGIIEALQSREWKGARVGVQLCGDVPNDRIVDFLIRAGASTMTVSPYAYVPAADDEKIVQLVRNMASGTVDVAAFTCSVQVDRLFDAAKTRGIDDTLRRGLRRTKIAALGPVVATALRDRGCRVDIIPRRSFYMRALLNEIIASLSKRPRESARRHP